MILPRPEAIRLLTQAQIERPLRPPFGLSAWNVEAPAAVVLLDASCAELDSFVAVAAQLPPATTLPPSTAVYVLGRAVGVHGQWWRLFSRRDVAVERPHRCGALLARGYVNLGAGTDPLSGSDMVWGFTPPC